MKQLSALIIAFILCLTATAQVGIGTNNPDSSAQLEVSNNSKGFLPPRVALTATNVAAPVKKPATGLLVYNTATSGGTPTNVSPGYYYWNGSSWQAVINKGSTPGDMQYWDGTRWVNIPLGLNGQNLTICNGVPMWGSCSVTLTVSPTNNTFEGEISSNAPTTFPNYSEVFVGAWTVGGNPSNNRILIKFDLSSIPSNAVIDSAKLYLYADSTPIAGNMIDAHFGSSNAYFIQRITSPWTTPSAYNWNNPPTTTSVNQVNVAQSASAFQDDIINMSALMQDVVTNGNNGFMLQLQTEVAYNIRQYVSSSDANPLRHPKLVISYH